MKINAILFFVCLISLVQDSAGQEIAKGVKLVPVANGWANNSINVVVFRKNSLVTDRDWQYISFYDENSYVVLGKRKTNSSQWQIKRTNYKGNTNDAHNTISMMIDGDGYLHLAWDHHNNALHYCRSVSPGSLELTAEMPMTGKFENRLSYPEFYRMPDGNLLFFYRDGGSGQGNLVINQYNRHTKQWKQLQSNLIDGQGERNAYWQACIDKKGIIHLSWVWRETPDVASNHDLCYARSPDGGVSWERSTGEKYVLPINATTAEYITRIPQKSELINQTSICTDNEGNPYVASYWRDSNSQIPQYRVLYKKSGEWKVENTGFRKTAFSLSGGGTKRIPISRPQVIAWRSNGKPAVAMIFRDAERGDKVSAAIWDQSNDANWKLIDLTSFSLGSWEPTFDTELWKQKGILQLFIQKVEQADAEGRVQMEPQPVQVLEWSPQKRKLTNHSNNVYMHYRSGWTKLSLFLLVIGFACSSPKKVKDNSDEVNLIDSQIKDGSAQYMVMMKNLPPDQFPKTYEPKTNKFATSGSDWWCSGFYPGTLLYLYEQTKDQSLYTEALRMLKLLEKEKYNTTTHDLGFMMFCSFGNANRIAPKQEYNEILLTSAKSLSTRFNPTVGCIKSWDSKPGDFLVIIDNMMNLELLFWATQYSGDSSFYKIAVTHANTTMKNHFRADNSSYHVLNYDAVTGQVKEKKTAQGYADESAWARGQAWGLYGYTVMYRITRDKKYLDQAKKIAEFILNHKNLPADKIPYWDFNAPDIPNALRDASAAAIVASALLELGTYVEKNDGSRYNDLAAQMIKSLSAPPYKALPGTNGGYIIQHCVGHMPNKTEIDVPLTYADYYYVEALSRYKSLLTGSTAIIPPMPLQRRGFNPGEVWTDLEGSPINAHGGGILHVNNKYYWFGEKRGKRASEGVNVYSSENLYDWKIEGLALAQNDADTTNDIAKGCLMERPKVIYNPKTKKYVMWFHLELRGKGYSAAMAGVAVSDKVTGPYRYVGSFRPNGNMSRDMTLFVDEDGSAYHIYSSRENYDLRIAKLTDDYLSASSKDSLLFSKHREAPALFKYDHKYYLITSGCTGWTPNKASVHESTSLFGPWKYLGDPMTGPNADSTFGGQSTYVQPVIGKENTFVFMADRWNPKDLKDSRYLWLPIRFKDGIPSVEWQEEWTLE